jgi:hypothetical protein
MKYFWLAVLARTKNFAYGSFEARGTGRILREIIKIARTSAENLFKYQLQRCFSFLLVLLLSFLVSSTNEISDIHERKAGKKEGRARRGDGADSRRMESTFKNQISINTF